MISMKKAPHAPPPQRRWLILAAIVLSLITLIKYSPHLVFTPDLAGHDRNSEQDSGHSIAWGPRPRPWLLLADPERSLFSGQEWYYRLYTQHCQQWLNDHHMKRPPSAEK